MTTHTSKNTKFALGAGMLTAGLVAGAMFSPLSLAGAQDTDADESTPGTTDDRSGGRHGHRDEVVAELLGITTEEIKAGFAEDLTLVQIAEANGVSESDLVAVIEAEVLTHLAQAVEQERLTQDEADERAETLLDRITDRVNTAPSEREDHAGNGRHGKFEGLEDLGLSAEAIQEGFAAGQTLAETAEANGVSEDALVDALVASAIERAGEAVESGKATQEQVDERLVDVEEHITERVNAEPGEHEGRREGRRGPRGSHGDVEEGSVSL